MKIKHVTSGEVIYNFPHYTKINGINGYLTVCEYLVLFFYEDLGVVRYQDVTVMYDVIIPNSCDCSTQPDNSI